MIGVGLMVLVGFAGVAHAQEVPDQEVVCLVSCDDDPDDADVTCDGIVEEGTTTCDKKGFGDETVEIAWQFYCSADCGDADGDGDTDLTTGEIGLYAYETSDQQDLDIWFDQTYKDGVDLDTDNDDNDNSDCGFWWTSGDDELDYLFGQISDDGGDGECPQDERAGYWGVGLDWDSD